MRNHTSEGSKNPHHAGAQSELLEQGSAERAHGAIDETIAQLEQKIRLLSEQGQATGLLDDVEIRRLRKLIEEYQKAKLP